MFIAIHDEQELHFQRCINKTYYVFGHLMTILNTGQAFRHKKQIFNKTVTAVEKHTAGKIKFIYVKIFINKVTHGISF